MRLIGRCAFTALTILMTSAGHAVLTGCQGSEVGPEPLDAEPANPGPDGGTDTPPGDGTPPPPPAPPPPAPPPPDGVATAGVFVSATKGAEDGDGSSEHPVKTLAQAIALAKEAGLPVNACAEAYAEAVTLLDGVTMYGYFDCADPSAWKRVAARAHIVAPTSPAVLGENLVAPARFEGFEIEAPDMNGAPVAGTPAASSYGMILRSSKNLAIEDVLIRAGKGQDGHDGVEAEVNAELNPDGAKGNASRAGEERVCVQPNGLGLGCLKWNFGIFVTAPATRTGSSGGVSQCKVGPNGGAGGRGGDGRVAVDGVYQVPAIPTADVGGKPLAATTETAKGGAASTVNGTPGAAGDPGTPGATGNNGTTGSWSFSAAGFAPGDGTAGEPGKPGQGGGGGAGASYWDRQFLPAPSPGKWIDGIIYQNGIVATGIGAGGGAGGCGGIAGTAGTGGGASIALFVVATDGITIAHSQMEAKRGGRAGKGTVGTLGTPGGTGGNKAVPTNNSFSGEAGGNGGGGGASGLSGHGAPGASIALVYSGTRPQTTEVVLSEGTAGEGAPALQRGAQTIPAVTGVAKQEHSF